MLPAKVTGDPLQVMVPVYWALGVIVVTGVAPVTGTVTPVIPAMLIVEAVTVATIL